MDYEGPQFSIIIPAFNSEKYIFKALDSIKRQDYENYELIVVCDRCIDRTAEIAKWFTDKVYEVDYGNDGPTRNFGIEKAKGKYIMFMDDDDWWIHEHVLYLLDLKLKQENYPDILVFGFIWKNVGYFCPPSKDACNIATWNKCWRRVAVGDTRFSNQPLRSDSDFHNEMMAKNLRMAFWDTPFYYYNYMREGSQTEIDERKKQKMKNKLLDIIITHYNEPWELVKPGLDMLANQICVDLSQIRVILIHDGSKKFKELEGYSFPFDFMEIEQEHGGVSNACNHGIDLAEAEWITFYDCDDSLSSIFSLSGILTGLQKGQFKFLWHPFYMTNIYNQIAEPAIIDSFNLVFKCAKYFKTQFLKENSIRFNEDLEFSEDAAFNNLVYLYCKDGEIGEISSAFIPYVWVRRNGSATDSDIYFERNCRHMLKSNIYSSEMYIKHSHPSVPLMVGKTITDTYVMLMQTEMLKHPGLKDEIEGTLLAYIKVHIRYLDQLNVTQWQYLLEISEGQASASLTCRSDRPPFIYWYSKFMEKVLEEGKI